MSSITVKKQRIVSSVYAIEPEKIAHMAPAGTKIDTLHDETFVSLIGYDVVGVTAWGIPLPASFPVVLLRIYVTDGDRPGFVNVRKFVPKNSVKWLVKTLFGEDCETRPMTSAHKEEQNQLDFRIRIKLDIHREKMDVNGHGPTWSPTEGSPQHWTMNRGWGFVSGNGDTKRYRYKHPVYDLHHVENIENTIALGAFGDDWDFLGEEDPEVEFMSQGTTVQLDLPESIN